MQAQEHDVTASAATPESPQLQAYKQQFEALKAEAQTLVAGLDEDAFNWKPAPDSWSVGECLDHLNVTGTLLLPNLDTAIERGRARNKTGDGPFTYGWVGRWWIDTNKPSGRRAKTPNVFVPSSSTLHKQETLEAFLALQDALIQRIRAADGLDLRRVKAPSAAIPLLRFSIGVWFESTLAHERRHLAQAQRVIAHADFPGNK